MYYRHPLLNKLERKFGKFGIANLMLILVGAMAIVYIMDRAIAPSIGTSLSTIMMFDRDAIMAGQVWRIFTFLFIPPATNIIFVFFALYFYWLIGSTLESQWGTFGFTLYYLLGALGAILSGLITGYATNSYLNMSLYFAFALLNPEFQILLFFVLPIKMKYVAIAGAAWFIWMFIQVPWAYRLSLLAAILNVLIFFSPQFIDWVKSLIRRIQWYMKRK